MVLAGAELQELQNEWEDYAFPPVGTAKFVLGMSIIQFIVKVPAPHDASHFD